LEQGPSPILLVDEDAHHRDLVSGLLRRAGYVTLGVRTGEKALAAARAHRPVLVMLEVKLPGLSGYEVCRELKEAYGDELPVFFLSGVRTEPFDRAAGLLIGADDYIVKPFDPDELLARVRRHATPPGPIGRRPTLPGTSELTGRELEILRLLADGLGQAGIAEELRISPKTVATHIQHILTKLEVHSRAQAVALAHRAGLLLIG
jgi:DNA-binding NarL/FixJ family response regulator